jgi:hypothetical protein
VGRLVPMCPGETLIGEAAVRMTPAIAHLLLKNNKHLLIVQIIWYLLGDQS